MSDLKVGDKVKFLNTSGGGVVSKLIDSRTVGVLIEDGFEIPTMISELVKTDSATAAGRFFEDHYNLDSLPEADKPDDRQDDRLTPLPDLVISSRKSEEIFLAFVPHDQKWLITGQLDVLLINNSSFDVLYNIFRKTPLNHYEGVDYGSIFPDSTLVLNTINREQVTHWTDGYIQFLFHKQQTKEVLPPFNAEFKVEGKRFFKEGNYRQNLVIKDKGIVIKVLSLTDYFREETGNQSTGNENIDQREKSATNPKPLIFRHQVAPREAEVDLHIHELVDDSSNFEKSEILEFQKNYFLKCLDSAMASHFLKVTFIHGVGNGVLRTAMIELLKKQEGFTFSDAPMAKYGIGALEITLPHSNH
ncbi:MAG: DUF2027 domain-containing protein [Bacteroidetes bacterium]|nr:DUF2027 domain-containing protein [Bacteroidota bacterium]